MLNTKLLASMVLVLAVLFAQVGNVAAAPQTQDTTYPQITEIRTETDENGETTVLVTSLLEDQTSETVRISLDYALELGLIDETTQEPVLPEDVLPGTTIDPAKVIEVVPVEEPVEEDFHPIVWLLAKFFDEAPSVVEGYHNDGFGFGVIAQALWISRNLTETEDEVGNASLAEDILRAKKGIDGYSYEDFFTDHPEYVSSDGTIPTNWGQFKKALSEKKNNLGVIVSEHDNQGNSTDELNQQNQGNGKDKQENQNKPPKKDKKDKKH